MTSRPEPINAIAYAQYHLRGGRRTLLWVFFGALVAIGGIGAITLGTSFNVREAARSAAGLLMVLQWLNLTLFTALRVGASVRQDFSSGMIESHRLTPASPVLSVLGYSVGAGVPLLTLSVAIGLAGAAFTVLADLPVTLWLVGNVMALGTGLLVWTLVTLLTVSTTNPGAVPGLGLLTLPAGGLVLLVPALGVLAAPLTGQSIWNPSGTGTGTLSPAYVLTLVADTLLAGTFTLAAARKYRSAVADAFNVRLSLLLLVIWTAVTLIGYARPDLFVTPSGGRGGTGDPTPRLIAAVISSALIALFPVIAAARASVWRPDTFAPGRTRRPAPPWLLIPLAAGLATAAVIVVPPDLHELWERQLGTFAVTLAWLAGVGFWVAHAHLRGRTGWPAVIGWGLLLNLAPLLGQAAVDYGRLHRGPPIVFCFAPVGALLHLWDADLPLAVPGVIAQLAYPLLPAAVFLARRRSDRHAGDADAGRGFAVELTTPPTTTE